MELSSSSPRLDRDLPLASVTTMKDQQSAVLSQPRFRTVLFGSFAVLALVLAIVGLYGVLAQLVARRTREIAVRMALGASRRAVLVSVIREALVLAAAGIVLGVAGSAFGVRVLTRLLYQVRAENAVYVCSRCRHIDAHRAAGEFESSLESSECRSYAVAS